MGSSRFRASGRRTVIIVCGAGDNHAIAVALHLEQLGVSAVPLDLALLPANGFSISPHEGSADVLFKTPGGPLDPAACTAVWWRRPQPIDTSGLAPAPRRLAENEWTAALAGLAHVVGGFWVNPPAAEEAARRKLVQLSVANAVGLTVPRTLVTNDLALARDFVSSCRAGGAVVKSLSSVREGGYTRRVTARDELLPERLRVGPAILQERVDGMDVRVTVVGDEVFAMGVDAGDGPGRDDVRIAWDGLSTRAAPERLPAALVRRIQELQRRLGLRFAAMDFRRDRAGRYVFLEVNPAGQWLHAEAATGHPIAATIARLLAVGGAGERQGHRDRRSRGAPVARQLLSRPTASSGTRSARPRRAPST